MKAFDLKKYMVNPTGKISKRVIYVDNNVVGFVLNIASGAALPNHTHFECTVLVQVLAGKGNLVINGEKTPITTGNLMQVEGQENMEVENTGDEVLRLYVTLSPIPPSEKYYQDVDM